MHMRGCEGAMVQEMDTEGGEAEDGGAWAPLGGLRAPGGGRRLRSSGGVPTALTRTRNTEIEDSRT